MKPFFIAEIGINHHGDFDKALRMVAKAADSGADLAKFQYYDPIKVLGADHPALEYAVNCQFSRLQHEFLASYCGKKGIKYGVSVFDVNDIPWAASLSYVMKVASRMNTNQEFIKKCIETDRGVVMSIQSYAQCHPIYKIHYMWCRTQYPANPIDALNHIFDEKHGLSSHCPDWIVSYEAFTRGARLFENHVTEDKTEKGCDISSSLDFNDYTNLIKTIKAHA